MKKLLVTIGLAMLSISCIAQTENRTLKSVSFESSGYELGLQHGKELKSEIAEIIQKWKKNASKALGKNSDEALADFYEQANFTESIKKWTPELWEEVKGIADGSEQKFEDIFVLNLLDEFWVYINNINNHHCSVMGVPATETEPGHIAQNMDLDSYTDGFQVLMRLEQTGASPERLILTYPGLIALNGLNREGIAVCVNTLMQLKASYAGLPVAFVIRRIIDSRDANEVLKFVKTVKHASGQNYMVGINGQIYDFEASANKVVRFDPENGNGTVYHTNHPIVNDDIKPWFNAFDPNLSDNQKPLGSNSFVRFKSVEDRMAISSDINENSIMQTLRSKDDSNHPVCRTNTNNGRAFTFASVIFSLGENPHMMITAGPPDESDYERFGFDNP